MHCVVCIGCRPAEAVDSVAPGIFADSSKGLAVGEAGGSALREYEKRHERRVTRIDERWGRLSSVVKFLSDDPQSTRAWAAGSAGEQKLAASLARRVGDRIVLLNDRRIPGSSRNIDHIAIAASGVWVIDAKRYNGLVERRNKGGMFGFDYRLYVNGRDRTKLIEKLDWQIDAVGDALIGEDFPIHAVVCFVDAEFRFFAKPFQLRGVWVTWGKNWRR
jgi:hypothetical protein